MSDNIYLNKTVKISNKKELNNNEEVIVKN